MSRPLPILLMQLSLSVSMLPVDASAQPLCRVDISVTAWSPFVADAFDSGLETCAPSLDDAGLEGAAAPGSDGAFGIASASGGESTGAAGAATSGLKVHLAAQANGSGRALGSALAQVLFDDFLITPLGAAGNEAVSMDLHLRMVGENRVLGLTEAELDHFLNLSVLVDPDGAAGPTPAYRAFGTSNFSFYDDNHGALRFSVSGGGLLSAWPGSGALDIQLAGLVLPVGSTFSVGIDIQADLFPYTEGASAVESDLWATLTFATNGPGMGPDPIARLLDIAESYRTSSQ